MGSSPAFSSESEMCAAFIEGLPRGWTAYAETDGWDILLVREADGFQIGIQAKLKLNAKVIAQATEKGDWAIDRPGPDCRAVLVPQKASELDTLAQRLALTVIRIRRGCAAGSRGEVYFDPALPEPDWIYGLRAWHELLPSRRCPLPRYLPDVAAGSSAPIQLTDWKIRAIKVAVLLDTHGSVTRADFKALGIDIRRWLDSRWIIPSDRGFVTGPNIPPFARQHPRVYVQIRREIDDWAPKTGELLAGVA